MSKHNFPDFQTFVAAQITGAKNALSVPVTTAKVKAAFDSLYQPIIDAYDSLMPVVHSLFTVAPGTLGTVTTTPAKVTAFTNGNFLNNGVLNTDVPTDKITATANGSYYLTLRFEGEFGNGVTVQFQLRAGGVVVPELPPANLTGLGTGNKIGLSKTDQVFSLGDGEIPTDLELYVNTVSGSTAVSFDELQLIVNFVPSSSGTAA